jgi:hypothetical protein
MATALKKSSSTTSKQESTKYKLDCQSKLTPETSDTSTWLNVLKKIPNVNILIGNIDISKKTIVVKFESYKEMEREYEISKKLYDSKLQNFIKYYCFFSCNEDRKKFEMLETKSKKLPLCTGPGTNTGFIIMPFYKLGSIAMYKWSTGNLHILKNILVQLVFALCDSFETIGFVHQDLHLYNVLLRKTKKKEICYKNINKSVKTEGFYPIIMDFGRAKVSASFKEFKTTLLKMFSLLRDIGINCEFILDPLPLVNYIRNAEIFNLDVTIEMIKKIQIDYIKI